MKKLIVIAIAGIMVLLTGAGTESLPPKAIRRQSMP